MAMLLHMTNGSLTDGDKIVHLRPFGIKLIEVLAPIYPNYVPKTNTFQMLGRNGEACDERTFAVQTHHIRQAIKAAGMKPIIDSKTWGRIRLLQPVEVEGYVADVIPSRHHKLLRELLYSHPNKSGADRIIACLDG